jgi:hypothetical protein
LELVEEREIGTSCIESDVDLVGLRKNVDSSFSMYLANRKRERRKSAKVLANSPLIWKGSINHVLLTTYQ